MGKKEFDLDIVLLDTEDEEVEETFEHPVHEEDVKGAPPSRRSSGKRRRKGNGSKAVKATARAASATGKAAYKAVGTIFRFGTFAIMAYMFYLLFSDFWSSKNNYGSIYRITAEKNYILAAYCVAALLILFYLVFSLLWSVSRHKSYHDGKADRTDTGRGFSFFILFPAGAFAAHSFASFIPEAPAFLQGVEGALSVYGALYLTLLPLCIAGIIMAVLRKFIFH